MIFKKTCLNCKYYDTEIEYGWCHKHNAEAYIVNDLYLNEYTCCELKRGLRAETSIIEEALIENEMV